MMEETLARSLKSVALLAALFVLAGTARAQGFPDKPIHFIVPFGPGTVTDQYARAIAAGVTELTGQPVVIDNRAGASGFIGTQQAAKAAPDGYTVLIATNTTHAANEHLFKKLPYDPVKDFAPVMVLGRGSQIMVVNPKVPANTVTEFVALAKKQPGKLTFGSGGSSTLVAAELFMQMTGTKLTNVPYKSNPLALNDVIGGQVDMIITDTATGIPQVKAGKVRALGVTSTARTSLAPDVPTIDEAGVRGYEMSFWFAAYVPSGTPAPIVKRLHEILSKATQGTAAENFRRTAGTEAFTTTPEGLVAFQRAEAEKWGRVIKTAGIQPE
jgi:tripartite-type tricarboxylate transporter receptor subunit TctC